MIYVRDIRGTYTARNTIVVSPRLHRTHTGLTTNFHRTFTGLTPDLHRTFYKYGMGGGREESGKGVLSFG